MMSADDIALLEGATKTDDFKSTDIEIPTMSIIQSNSPHLIRGDANYIEAARPGDIIDTMHRIPRQRIAFVPVKFERTFAEWKPNRGGIVRQWGTDSSKYDASGNDYGTRRTAEGNDIVPAAAYYGLVINEDGSTIPVILRMGGSQFKKSRRLNMLISMLEVKRPDGTTFTPPMFSRVYSMETVGESNDMGNWYGWKIEPGAHLLQVNGGKEIFQKADKLRSQIDAGTARAAPEPGTAASSQASSDAASRDEEVPF